MRTYFPVPRSLIWFLFLFHASVFSQNFWQQTNGPYGGTVLSLAVAPNGDMFAGTSGGGVYRSADGGGTWINVGLANSRISALVVNHSGAVFAGSLEDGLFRSTDGGGSWTQTGLASTCIWSLALNATGHIYAGAAADIFGLDGTVFRSTDNGGTWTQTSLTVEDEIRTLAINSNGHVFAGACADLFGFSGGLYRTMDNGGTWTQVTTGLTSTPARALAISASGVLFAGTGGGVFRSTNNGSSWSQSGLTTANVSTLAIAANGQIFAGTTTGVYRSADSGATWNKAIVGLTSISVNNLTVGAGGRIFAGTSGGGAFLSIDNGGSWNPVNAGVAATRVQSLKVHSAARILAGTDIGMFLSRNSGGDWLPSNIGLSNTNIRSVTVHSNGVVFAGTNIGVSRSLDTARTWTSSGLSFTSVYALDVLSNGHILAGTGSGVFRSTDNGGSWVQVGLAGTPVVALTVQSSGTVFAGINNGTFRSTDNGSTWTQAGLTGTIVRSLASTSFGYALAGTDNGVYRSGDNGASWNQVGVKTSVVTAFSTNSSGHLFAGTATDGVFQSTDNGSSWSAVSTGLSISSVLSLTGDAVGFVYAGTGAGGVFRTTQSTLPVSTDAATEVGTTTATLNGTVNPSGIPTTAYFEWGTNSSLSGSFTTASQTLGSGISSVPVTAQLTGLSPRSTYYFRLVSQNNAGTRRGSILSFSTSANLPVSTTGAATSVTTNSATLNGSVNPNGSSTTAFFDWGTNSALSTPTTTSSQAVGSGTTPISFSANLTGLTPSTTYYFRAVAQNSGGPTKGSILSFTTISLLGDPYEPNNSSTKATSIAYGFTSSGAALNPAGDVDYYKFTASAGDFIAIEALSEDVSELNLRISLFDATGTEVASSDIVSTGTERILYGVGRAQQYFIRVVEASDTASFPNGAGDGGEEPAPLGKRSFRSTSGQSAVARSSAAATPAYTLALAKGTPLPPVGLSAGGGFNGLVPLRWLQPASNPPLEYRVYRSTSAAGPFNLIGSTWRESFVDTTAANVTLYHYHVKSIYDATNAESGPSNVDKATPRALGFRFSSRFATVKPTMDGTLRASEWPDAQADNIAIRRTTAEPPSVTLLVKNDASTLYVGIIDSNASASTWNRLVLAFDSDNNKRWDKALPSNEGFLVIDDSAGTAIVEYYGVAGMYPDVEVMDAVRNPKGMVARLSRVGSSVHYEISIDFASISPVVGASAAIGMYVTTISDEFSGEYPLQAIVLAPMTFAEVVLAKPSAVITLVSPLNASLGVSTSPTLSWNPVTGATGYRLQVATDSNFVVNVAVDQNNITGTSYTATGLATGTVYFWRVMANVTGSVGSWSATWRFTTYLGAVSLVSPIDKATGVSGSPTLSWNAVKGATSYHLQVSFNSTFTPTTAVDQSGITGASYAVSGLRSDTVHYWRVEALNAGGSSGWSSTWSFRTQGSTPPAPTLSSPNNNASGQTTTLTLSWGAATAAASYHLQVAINSSFTAPYVFEDSALSATTKQLSGLAESSTYYWRVRGRNTGGYGSWSTSYAFSTASAKTVTSTGVAFPTSPTVSTDYRLVSFPGASSLTVGQVLTGSQNTEWRIFRDNGGTVPNNLSELSSSSTFTIGEGYWLLAKGTFSYSRSTTMPQLSGDGTYTITVRNGWNIIGNPFDVPLSWASVRLLNSFSSTLWTYSGSTGFQQTTVLDPFRGYYVFTPITSLKIRYPFPAMKLAEPSAPPIDWRIQLALETDLSDDAENYVGIAPDAETDSDELDQEDPPPLFDQGSLSIVRQSRDGQSSLLSADFRPSIGEGQVWRFEVSNPKRLAGRIRALGVEELPIGLEIRLIGAGCSDGIDLRRVSEIPLQTASDKWWFNLVVGAKAFVEQQEAQLVPKNFELFQNYPNPFNPSTAISYQLSALSVVKLSVFDPLGREVATLVNAEQPAGRYQVTFNAGALTSGIYFYRLQARHSSGGSSGTFVDTRKLVLVK